VKETRFNRELREIQERKMGIETAKCEQRLEEQWIRSVSGWKLGQFDPGGSICCPFIYLLFLISFLVLILVIGIRDE
jgi:hypothetical protein